MALPPEEEVRTEAGPEVEGTGGSKDEGEAMVAEGRMAVDDCC